ncbi:hypothetical protein AHF37_01164 [Paragonimus kellicotti]|nr:hypothetical protein AHF37_01164 [Paragonimus kellicotti]
MRSGYGVYRYPKGATYEGFWQAGKRSGDGTLHWTDRDEIYTGTWVDGKQHGLGCHAWHILRVRTTQYSLPNVYDGQWENGKRSGLGTFHYPNGSKYVGYWENNLKHGKGTIILKDGRICERQFFEDRLVSCAEDSQSSEIDQLGLERLDTRMPLWTEEQFKSSQLEFQLCDTSDSNLLEHYLRPHIAEPYYNDMEMSKPSEALVCLMTQAVIPHACKIVSPFYSDENKARVIMRFMESNYQFFRFLVHLRNKPEVTPSTITMRDFIFMLRDLKLLDEDLPVNFVIEILCGSNPSAGPFKECDLETELTFFDFFEALVQCATISLLKAKSPPPPAIVETQPSREEVRNTEVELTEQPEVKDEPERSTFAFMNVMWKVTGSECGDYCDR